MRCENRELCLQAMNNYPEPGKQMCQIITEQLPSAFLIYLIHKVIPWKFGPTPFQRLERCIIDEQVLSIIDSLYVLNISA